MHIFLSIAAAMFFGLLLTRAAKKAGLPNVTAYLIAGLIIGPYCLKLVPAETSESLSFITTIALGFIAFSIGGEFRMDHLKSLGSKAVTITMFQAFGAVILVDAVLLICGFDAPLAITLGAIATATAPAATLMVVRQYKAKGAVTSTLLPVVAMDDAVGLVVFAVSVSIAQSMSIGTAMSFSSAIIAPFTEIVLSLGAGLIIGILTTFFIKFFHARSNFMCIAIAAVILGVGVSEQFGLSSLLLCMMIGATVANLCKEEEKVLNMTDTWTPPLFMLFFVLSGAELDLSALPSVGLLGVLYLIARSLGKYFGTYLGSKITKADPNVKKYLGIALLPQAGVAIGMAQLALTRLPAYGKRIQVVVLCATLIYELVGPVLTKWALIQAGEIERAPKKEKAKV